MTKVFHLHIRKTAGTALFHALKERFGSSAPYRSDFEIGVKVPSDQRVAELSRYPLISGHFYSTAAIVPDDYDVVTILRNPFSRVVSAYNHIRADKTDLLHKKLSDRSLEQALDDPALASELWNGTTRALVAASGGKYEDLEDAERIETALSYLQNCRFVGFQEALGVFFNEINAAYGTKADAGRKVNVETTASGLGREAAFPLARKIAGRNTLDVIVYDEALSRFLFPRLA